MVCDVRGSHGGVGEGRHATDIRAVLRKHNMNTETVLTGG